MTLKQNLFAQFGKPSGLLGSVAGTIMAKRPSNIERTEWTLSLLDIDSAERVLEIGCGPGVAINAISSIVTHGSVVGIDHSDVMVQQATRRNRAAINTGRVKLLQASVSALPQFRHRFDTIFSINVVQFWENPVKVFTSLRSLLQPGGTIATTYEARHLGSTDADTLAMGKVIAKYLVDAGFSRVESHTKQMQPVAAVCVLAMRDAVLGPRGNTDSRNAIYDERRFIKRKYIQNATANPTNHA